MVTSLWSGVGAPVEVRAARLSFEVCFIDDGMVFPTADDFFSLERMGWPVMLAFSALVGAQCAGLCGGSILSRSFVGQ